MTQDQRQSVAYVLKPFIPTPNQSLAIVAKVIVPIADRLLDAAPATLLTCDRPRH